jgi:signal transduction histidine kinase
MPTGGADLHTTEPYTGTPVPARGERLGGRALSREPIRVLPAVAGAAAVGLAVTLLVSLVGVLDFAYRSTSLHVAVETAAALASIVAAQSFFGRFLSSLQLRDLALTASLGFFASVNLLFTAVPALFTGEPGPFRTWAPVLGHLAATALLAAAAFLPERVVHKPRLAATRALVGCEVAVGAIAGIVLLLGDALPEATAPASAPANGQLVTGDPLVVATQLLSAVLFGAAAVAFARRAARTHDPLLRWVAVAATLGGFARLNYFLFPSLYTTWFYAGDGLRLLCFVALFAAGVQETRRLQRALAASAVLEERRRIARDLHDGVTQDLAYIVQQLRHIADRPEAAGDVGPLVRAAEGALDGSRDAIAALTRPSDCPLSEAVATTVREAAEREGFPVELELAQGVHVPARTQQELLRVVREAVINSIRHSGAEHLRVRLTEQPVVCVSVADDGVGFDPSMAPAAGHLGLASMAARVRAIGGELTIDAAPQRGTEVRVTLR